MCWTAAAKLAGAHAAPPRPSRVPSPGRSNLHRALWPGRTESCRASWLGRSECSRADRRVVAGAGGGHVNNYGLFINGEEREGATGAQMPVIYPYTGEPYATV